MSDLAIKIVIFLAICALLYVAITVFSIPIPGWVWTVIGIVLIACVLIYAIKFVKKQE